GALGLRDRRAPEQRGADRRAVQRHPPGARLSGMPRAFGEGDAVAADRPGAQRRHQAHRELRDVAGRGGVGLVLLASAIAVLRRRPHQQGAGRRLCAAQGLVAARRGEVAGAEPRVRAGGLRNSVGLKADPQGAPYNAVMIDLKSETEKFRAELRSTRWFKAAVISAIVGAVGIGAWIGVHYW